jgi:hypothetical protein
VSIIGGGGPWRFFDAGDNEIIDNHMLFWSDREQRSGDLTMEWTSVRPAKHFPLSSGLGASFSQSLGCDE